MSARAEPASVRSVPPRASRLPLTLIIVSLLLLGTLPIMGDRYVDVYRADVRELVEPARNLTTEIHLSLSLGSAALRDYLNTGDTVFLSLYQDAVTRERAAYRQLAPLAARLDTAVLARYNWLRAQEMRWHDRIHELLQQKPLDLAVIRRSFASEQLYENTITAAARLDDALARAATMRRQRIDRAERVFRELGLALATVALGAALIALSIGRRLSDYALALEEKQRQLEQVLASRTRLARGITHDLKNPLNAILGNVQLLDQNLVGELTPAQHERIHHAEKSALSMLSMIESLLELESARSGQLQIATRRVDLGTLVEDVAESQRAAIEEAGLNLSINLGNDVGPVETDPERVRRILENLLSNARKYSSAGCVRVHTAVVKSRARGPGEWIAISVQDSGRGIPQDKIEHVFEEFSRLETGSIPGSGLGLAVSRRLAQLMGGDLTATSEPGKGSKFTLWLPANGNSTSRPPSA